MDLVLLTETIVKMIVKDVEAVSVKEYETTEENFVRLEVMVSGDDLGRVIGKNGRTIAALQTIIRQIISSEIDEKISIVLDVENYKEKRVKNIEYLAKKTAREVAKTKVEATMDSMNSYERRIVHSVLADDKYVYTESTGEEPNRCVVIKLKEQQ